VHKTIQLVLLLLLTAVAVATTNAQSPSSPIPVKHYNVDFLVKEVDAAGRVTNSRSYSTVLATTNQGDPNQIRSGNRVPIRLSTGENAESGRAKGDIAYIDVGVNIDCRFVQEIDQKLAMKVKAEISSIPAGTDLNSGLDPVLRQFQWNADVLIPPGIPTTIFSSDDVNSKSRIQLEVNATLIR
jgi:hypothetical protein